MKTNNIIDVYSAIKLKTDDHPWVYSSEALSVWNTFCL